MAEDQNIAEYTKEQNEDTYIEKLAYFNLCLGKVASIPLMIISACGLVYSTLMNNVEGAIVPGLGAAMGMIMYAAPYFLDDEAKSQAKESPKEGLEHILAKNKSQ